MLTYFYKDSLKKNLSNNLKSKSIDLKQRLDNYRDDVQIFSSNSNLAKTILWLFEKQNKDGSWGNDNIATTAITMLALKNIEQPATAWGYSDQLNTVLEKAETYLTERFKKDMYESALWDTSIATRALTVCCPNSREFINTELIPILLHFKTDNLNAGPHHLAQRILTLKEFGVEKKLLEEAVSELNEYLTKNNWSKNSPYIISQCLEALSTLENGLNIDKYVEYLINWLQNNSLDSANFVNVCSTLISIKPKLNLEVENKLKYTVSSLFGSHCFRYDGSWYYDEYITSYAILALAKYEKEILIRAPRIEFNYEINTYIDNVLNSFENYSKNETSNWLLHIISIFLGTSLITTFIVYLTLEDNILEWVKWVLPTLGSFFMIFSISELIRRLVKK
jgi:hypothetical protein